MMYIARNRASESRVTVTTFRAPYFLKLKSLPLSTTSLPQTSVTMKFLAAATGTRETAFSPTAPAVRRSVEIPVRNATAMTHAVGMDIGVHIIIAGSMVSEMKGLRFT